MFFLLLILFSDIFPKYLTKEMKSMTREFFTAFQKCEDDLEKEERKHMG